MAILTAVFSMLLRTSIPQYAPWVLIGILVWRLFSVSTSQGLQSIIGNPSLVNKVYIPRYLIILSNNIANLIGSSLEFIVLLPLLMLLGIRLTWYALYLPIIILIEFLLIFALSLSLASLNVKYRDFYQLWDIALQLGFFLSPIVYDPTLIPPHYQFMYSLNPLTELIQAARDALLYAQPPTQFDTAVILSGMVVLLLLGIFVFQKLEPKFAEEL
jgi:lipopolysaccharide transport system permease protein